MTRPADPSLDAARDAVNQARFVDEAAAMSERIAACALSPDARAEVHRAAAQMVQALREDPSPDLMESFLAEYGLSTDEGVALMCLAEAYLRVPDAPTLDALIRDKIGGADWSRHSGQTESLLVNASTWALMLTGRIYREGAPAEAHLVSTLRRMVRRVGEPVVRTAVAQAMRVMGQQFVLGEDIDEALERGADMEERGYGHSFDMLGEAARTEVDARRYSRAYSNAIAAISRRAKDGSAHDNAGISVKLSALHPRYETVQRTRVLDELVPRLGALVEQARNANIGFNVDAEEAERLGLSLEVMQRVADNADLAGWDGFGIVVQAYSKQSMAVLRWAHALSQSLGRRVAVRLVKGAYWDAEIKHAQVLGLDDYPVFTRKVNTDVSYLAGARFLLDHADCLFPQFATHNAHTAAAIVHMAGDRGGFEFQRLHGMGEALHERLRATHGHGCRIYAPVGVHEDLLAYLVRRLLENGANSSFVHQLLDTDVPVARLVEDPLGAVESREQVAHPGIALPPALFGAERRNSRGCNPNDPVTAQALEAGMEPFRSAVWEPALDLAGDVMSITNPARPDDVVGRLAGATPADVDRALQVVSKQWTAWRDGGAEARAAVIERVADLYEAHGHELMALLTREAGKTRLDGILEVREAVDFCRYYAAEARALEARGDRTARGVFACISPWNFPLAIFTGQVVAALVSGNAVLAKPAEQTPLVAARAVALMHEAGVPDTALVLLPGDGTTVGAALCADRRIAGVCFTGSTATAMHIDRALARGAGPSAPLIAETGGLNAMIVDSTALPEAAVRDIVASAFQSAGQRCSALRALFLQRDVAPRVLEMLEGATEELGVGDPWSPAVDVGPVIDEAARARIEEHREAHASRVLFRHAMQDVPPDGRFVAPTAIRLGRFEELHEEIFGPVLHVLDFESHHIDAVVDAINASGYGLTFGMHSRIDDRVEAVCARIRAGNAYVNRNQIGAVVGVQPFGGEGLSGTGPKAGGPGYVSRFTVPAQRRRWWGSATATDAVAVPVAQDPEVFADSLPRVRDAWDARRDRAALLHAAAGRLPSALAEVAERVLGACGDFFATADALPGPTGEENHLTLHGRGIALCLGPDDASLVAQAMAALAAGNAIAVPAGPAGGLLVGALAAAGVDRALVGLVDAGNPADLVHDFPDLAVVVYEGSESDAGPIRESLARRDGRRVLLLSMVCDLDLLATERHVSIDTTASGGNASLLMLADE